MSKSQRVVGLVGLALCVLGGCCVFDGCHAAAQVKPPPQSAEPPVYGECRDVGVDPKKADDDLFLRLRPRIRQEMLAAVEEAASDKPTGAASLLAVALGKLVMKVVKTVVEALLLAALVALAWKYWWVVTSLYATAGFAGWLGGRKSGGTKP